MKIKVSLYKKFLYWYKDWYCGFKSGIPICCVIFYNLIWKYISGNGYVDCFPNFCDKYRKLENKRVKSQYIPCPICILRKKYVEIKWCDWFRCIHNKKIRCSL